MVKVCRVSNDDLRRSMDQEPLYGELIAVEEPSESREGDSFRLNPLYPKYYKEKRAFLLVLPKGQHGYAYFLNTREEMAAMTGNTPSNSSIRSDLYEWLGDQGYLLRDRQKEVIIRYLEYREETRKLEVLSQHNLKQTVPENIIEALWERPKPDMKRKEFRFPKSELKNLTEFLLQLKVEKA